MTESKSKLKIEVPIIISKFQDQSIRKGEQGKQRGKVQRQKVIRGHEKKARVIGFVPILMA